MITYKQIKDEIMALGLSDPEEYENYKDAVVPAVNAAISDLSNIAARKRRTYSIMHSPEPNVIDAPAERLYGIYEHTDKDLIFTADSAKAYTFYCSGTATVYIESLLQGQWQTLKTILCASQSPYSLRLYRGFTESEENAIRLRFSGEYAYRIKGPAMYAHVASDAREDIQPYDIYTAYDMRKLTSGIDGGEFLAFDDKLPVCTCDGYAPYDGYAIESDSVVLLPRKAAGQYIISYIACPSFVTEHTPDAALIDLPQDAAKLIALYAAARVFKAEDAQLADSYAADYERLKQQLYHELPVHTVWTSYYGW